MTKIQNKPTAKKNTVTKVIASNRTTGNGNGHSRTEANLATSRTRNLATATRTAPVNLQAKMRTTLDDLLHDGLKDILDAERQLIPVLTEIARACNSEELQETFEKHLQQTQRHVERVEKVMQRLGIPVTEKETCEAMEGLIKEVQEIIERYEMNPVRDSALIIAAQKIEHYEIAAYGSLCELCDVLGYPKMSDLLGRSLDEEETHDRLLTEIAQDINDEAHELSMQEEEMFGE